MDKDDGCLYISYEAQGQLFQLAKRLKMDEAKVLEMLIKDRFSISDTHKNAHRRLDARDEYLSSQGTNAMNAPELAKAFVRGYNLGWVHFQVRHGEDMFVIEVDNP